MTPLLPLAAAAIVVLSLARSLIVLFISLPIHLPVTHVYMVKLL
jgi:hypothetical protein